MRVVFSSEAETDLEQIGNYIAQENPTRAITFVRELRQAALRISGAPRAFPVIPRYAGHGLRRRAFGDYLVFYRIDDEQLAIVRILHGARDYEALLFPDA